MNINVGIVDQQVGALSVKLRAELDSAVGRKLDDTMARSVAFVVLVSKTVLDLTDAEALELLTEGSTPTSSAEGATFVQSITYATNSQNPVDLRDLRSNDARQKSLEASIQGLGFEYRRQRSAVAPRPVDISTATAAEAVLAVWRRKPQQAKFRTTEHFGKLYDTIFTEDLQGTHVVTAVLLFRIAENKRKRPTANSAALVPYAACFAAMLMGQYLLEDMGIALEKLDHRNFEAAQRLIDTQGEAYFARAITALEAAVAQLYGGRTVSLQQLSATFRRGDLFQYPSIAGV